MICISNHGLELYEEFLRWVEQSGKYIILVDDANNVEQMEALIRYSVSGSHYDIRFVMTVRDYARDSVLTCIRAVSEANVFEIAALSDEEVTEFIGKVLDIRNQHYVDQIVRIAEGNPRIAYMAGKLAIENDLSRIQDVSSLMDQYYAKVIDKSVGNDEFLCITAGILALIHAVSLSNLENLEEIFQSGIIERNGFVECCKKLVNLEVAEERYSIIVFSDQCFANYMIYYTFFRRKLIPFSTVLDIGFRFSTESINQAASVILNIFNNEDASDYLKDQVRIVWDKYKNGSNQELFERFAEVYHLFFPDESLLLAKRKIDAIETEVIPDSIDFDRRMYDYSDPVLNLLNGYATIPEYLDNAIDLALQFALKSELNLIKFKHWFNTNFEINEDSGFTGYKLQDKAIAFMNKHCLDYIPASKVFLSIGSEWLTSEFNPISVGRNNSLRIYHVVYQYSEEAAHYRASIFEMILKIANEASYKAKIHDDIMQMLRKYAQYVRSGLDQKFTKRDAHYIEEIINGLPDDLNKAIIVNRLLESCSIHHYDAPWDFDLEKIFSSESWQVYSLFSNDYVASGLSYDDFRKQRQKRIEDYAKTLTVEKMNSFVESVEQCIVVTRNSNNSYQSPQTINEGLKILCKAFSDDHALSMAYLSAVQENGNDITCRPYEIFINEINRDYQGFYDFIVNGTYASATVKNDWLYVYFAEISEEKCDQWALEKLLLFLKDDSDQYFTEYSGRSLEFLLKFRKTENNIFPITSRMIFEKVAYKKSIPAMYFDSLFHAGFVDEFNPENLLALYRDNLAVLKKVYSYELQIDHLSDYDGKYLSCFCQHDPSWLDEYCSYLFQVRGGSNSVSYEQERLQALWQLDEYESLFDSIFQYAVRSDDSAVLLKNSSILRFALGRYSQNPDIVKKQKQWYLRLIEEHAFSDRLKFVFFMCSDLDDEFKLEMFQKFLTLNQNFDAFKELPFFPNSFFVAGSFVPVYKRRKEFLLKLLNMMQDVKFLEHRNLVNEMITDLDDQITSEETREVLRKANGW